MANNQNRVNALLEARNIIGKAQAKNQEQGIYTAQQRNAYVREQERVRMNQAAQNNNPMQYVDEQRDSKLGYIKDLGLSVFADGIVGVGEGVVGIANIPTLGRAGKILEDAFGYDPKQTHEFIGDFKTARSKEQMQEFSETEGFVPKLGNALSNPSIVANTIGESLPSMFAGGAIGKGAGLVAKGLPGFAAGALGEGIFAAGMSAEQIRQQTDDGVLTPKQTALAAASGAATGAISLGGGALARKLGITDLDTALATGARTVSNKGVLKATAQGVLSEGVLEELPQSVSETVLQNIALDKPLTESVTDAAALGLLSGAAMGGTISGSSALKNKITDKVNKNNFEDESVLLDPTNPKYNPAEVIKRSSAVNAASVTESELTAAKKKVDGIRNKTIADVTSLEEELAASKQFDSLLAIARDDNSTTDEKQAALQQFQELQEKYPDAREVADIEKALDKAKSIKDQADTEYFQNIARLDDIRANKEFAPFKDSKETVKNNFTTPTIKAVEVDDSSFDATNTGFAPSTTIKALRSKVSTQNNDAEIDSALTAAEKGLEKITTQVESLNADKTELNEIDKAITQKSNEIESREQRLKSAKDDLNKNTIEASLKEDEAALDKLIAKRKALNTKIKKVNPNLETELVNSKKEFDGLTDYTKKLKAQRAEIISGLRNKKSRLEGKTDPVSVKQLEEVEDQLEEMTFGKLTDEAKVNKRLKRDYDKALEKKKTIDKVLKGKETKEKEVAKLEAELAQDIADGLPSAIVKRTRNKLKKAKEDLAKYSKRVTDAKVKKVNDEVTKTKAAYESTDIEEKAEVVKDSEAVTEIKTNISDNKTQLKNLKDRKKEVGPKDSSTKSINEMITKLEAAIAEDEASLAEVTGQEVEKKEKKSLIEKSGDILTRRLRGILNSPTVMGNKVSANKKLVLEAIARQLDKLRVEENVLKDADKVSNDILIGTDKYWGLRMYEAALATAVEADDKAQFNLYLGKLKSFSKGHSNKSAALNAAAERFSATGKKQVVYRVKDSQTEWTLKEASKFEANSLTAILRKTGSLLIDEKSNRLVSRISEEASLVETKLDKLLELQAEFESETSTKEFVPNDALVDELGEFIKQDDIFTNTTKLSELKAVTNKDNSKEKGVTSDVTHTEAINDEGNSYEKLKDNILTWFKTLREANPNKKISSDAIVNNMRAIAKAANKSIAFGTPNQNDTTYFNWEAAFNQDFTGMNNTVTFNDAKYDSTDVVAIVRNETNDSVEMARARKKEIDAAIEAGATLLIPDVGTQNLTKLNDLVNYITEQGYTRELVSLPVNNKRTVKVAQFVKDINEVGKPTKKKVASKPVENTTEDTSESPTPVESNIKDESGLLELNNSILTQRDTVLNGQKNLFSKLIASKDYAAIAELVGFELTDNNKKQLDSFIRLHSKISSRVNKALKDPESTSESRLNPLYQNLVTKAEDGSMSVPENVVTAMTLSLFQYIQTNGKNSYLDEETWRKVHGLNKYVKISNVVKFALSKAGGHRPFLFQELGTGATRALGLSTGQEAEFTTLENLQASLGALTYAIVNEKVDTPMFKEMKLTKLEQIMSVVQGMDAYTAKKYINSFGENGVADLFLDSNLNASSIQEAKTTADILKILKATKPRSNNSALNKTITLSRANIENEWDKKTKTSTTTMQKDIKDIIESSNREDGSKDVLDKIFNNAYERVEPLDFKPESFDQDTVIKGTTEIPDNMKEALLKQSQHEWKVQEAKSEAMLNLYDNDKQGFYELLGVKTDADIAELHPSLRDEATTDRNIQVDLLEKQVAWLKGREKGSSFWHKPVVWVNQRVGYASTLFNAQTNMFARMLSSMKGWETNIDTTQELMTGNKVNLHGRFFLALAESMEGASKLMDFEGTKYRAAARTVDKVRPQDFLPRFTNYLETSPVIADAVAAIRLLNEGKKLDTKSKAAIKTAVKELDMDELGLGALMEYTSYLDNKDSGTYTTQMGSQSDGITNGPMITKFLLAVADSATRKMGGILSNKDKKEGIKNFLDTKALGDIDLYENTGFSMGNSLEAYLPEGSGLTAVLNTIKQIDGDFGSRKWAKKLLTPFNYGAGLPRLMEAINNNVSSQFEDEYNNIYHEKDKTKQAEKLTAFNKKLSSIIEAYNETFTHQVITDANKEAELDKLVYIYNAGKKTEAHISPTLDFNEKAILLLDANNLLKSESSTEALVKSLNYLSQARMRKGVFKLDNKQYTLAEIEETLDSKYTSAVDALSNITYATAAIRAIEIDEAAYIEKRDLLQEFASTAYTNYEMLRRVYTNQIAKDPMHVTKKEQGLIDKALNKNKSAVPSAMSNLNRDPVSGKRKPGAFRAGIDLENVTFSVAESRNIPFNVFNKTRDEDATMTYNYGYVFKTMGDPGVRTLALMIQSLDSSVSVQALADFEGMNFHDANVFSLTAFEDGVRKQNEAFFDAVIKYEPSVEMAQAMIRPLYKLREMMLDKANETNPTTEVIYKYLRGLGNNRESVMENIEILYDTEIQKLEDSIANDAIIHQYGGIGGEAEVTNEQRQAMRVRINELYKEKAKALETYEDFVTNFDKLPESITNPKTETELLFEEISALDKATKVDLLKDLIKTEGTNVNNLIDYLVQSSTEDSQLYKVLDGLKDMNLSKIKIKMVGKDIPNSGLDTNESTRVRYSKFSNTINVSTENDIGAKDIVRELYVAAMHQNLVAIKNGSNNNPELTKQYNALKVIMKNLGQTVTNAVNNGSITDAEAAVIAKVFNKNSANGNVELLMFNTAYNPEIQDILSRIKTSDTESSILDKIKSFITSIFKANGNSVGSIILDTTIQLEKGIVEARSTQTINQMISDSLKSQVLPFNPVSTDLNIEAYETRFQLEMRKLKIKNKGKGIPAADVINLMDSITNSVEFDGSEGYHSLLKPTIQLLKQNLNSKLEVVLIDELQDYYDNNMPAGLVQRMDNEAAVQLGNAFYDEAVKKVYLHSSQISDNNVMRMSVVIHEMFHGLTHSIIKAPLNKQSDNTKKSVKAIADLRKQAREYAEANNIPLNDNVHYALYGDENYKPYEDGRPLVDEFVVQIMSSKEVRDFLVKVPVASNKRKESNASDNLTEAYNLIEGILSTDTKSLKAEGAELNNALRNFSTIFSGLVEDTKSPNKMSVAKPVELTDEFIGIQAGLTNLSAHDQIHALANELTAFSNGTLRNTLENMLKLKEDLAPVNKVIEEKGLKPTEISTESKDPLKMMREQNKKNSMSKEERQAKALQEAKEYEKNNSSDNTDNGEILYYQTALDNPTQYVVDTVAEANEAIRAREILQYNQDASGQARQPEKHAPRVIADFLAKHSTRDNSYLNRVISNVVNPLVDKISPSLVEGYDHEKVWHDAIVSGKDVYSSQANDAGFNLDDQQSYVLEVLEVALLNTLDEVNNSAAFRQLEKTYTDAKNTVSIRDFHNGVWSEATAEEQELAETKYNFIFRPAVGAVGGKSNYLSNFMSMVLVSPEVRSIMNVNTKDKEENSSWFGKLVDIFDSIVEFWEGKTNAFNPNDTVSNKVADLSRALADVYYKNLDKVITEERGLLSRTEDHINELSEDVLERMRKTGVSLLSSNVLGNNSAAKLGVKALEGKFDNFELMANQLFDYISPNAMLGDVRETINETLGTLDNVEHKDTMSVMRATKAIEQERGAVIDDIGKAMNEAFSEDNQELSEEDNKGISNTMLRTDLHTLLNSFNFNEIVGLIKNKSSLTSEIRAVENTLKTVPNGLEYINRTKALANYMVHRKSTSTMLAKNPLAIADRVGLSGKESAEYTDTTLDNIDKLASLYALQLTNSTDKKNFLKVLDREANNSNKLNGLEYMMNSHRDFVKESQELFYDNPYSITKGYLPNLVNPNKGFEVVDKSEVAVYESLGYKKSSELAQSPLDTVNSDKVIMTVSNNGKQRYVSGALSIEDTGKAGTVVVRRGEKAFVKILQAATAQAIKDSKNLPNTTNDINKANLVPSYDTNGEVVSFSYEMSHVALDNYLERNNTASTMLSQLKGANLGKKMFPEQNRRAVDYLNKQYDNSTAKEKNKFVLVSPDSRDKKVRDKWNSLPKETQMYIEKQNGEKAIYMRNDEMNLLFGFRKFNPGDAFDKNVMERNLAEALYTGLLSSIPGIGNKAQLRNNQLLTFWIELIKTLKDYIVVRGVQVLWANIKSNAAFLMLNSSDPVNAFKDIKDALTYSMKYQRDKHEMTVLKHELRIGLSDAKKLSRYVELQDTIARNPLSDFIEAGMMPSIVNDVSFKKGEVSYKTAFDRVKDNTLGRLPTTAQKGIDYLLVAPGTPIYSFLSNATQQSDFVFKYALYKQELRKGNNKKQAMDLARQVFIEYDVPTNQTIQFVNDIGLWMFTKFALRIQRVLMHYARTRPGKLLLEHAVSSGLMNNPSILSLNLGNMLIGGSTPFDVPGGDVVTMTGNALPMQLIADAIK